MNESGADIKPLVPNEPKQSKFVVSSPGIHENENPSLSAEIESYLQSLGPRPFETVKEISPNGARLIFPPASDQAKSFIQHGYNTLRRWVVENGDPDGTKNGRAVSQKPLPEDNKIFTLYQVNAREVDGKPNVVITVDGESKVEGGRYSSQPGEVEHTTELVLSGDGTYRLYIRYPRESSARRSSGVRYDQEGAIDEMNAVDSEYSLYYLGDALKRFTEGKSEGLVSDPLITNEAHYIKTGPYFH